MTPGRWVSRASCQCYRLAGECRDGSGPLATSASGSFFLQAAQRVNDQCEGRRCLATARVIEVVSAPGRGPVLKYPNELPFGHVGPRKVLGDVGESKTIQGGIPNLEDV